MTDISSPSPDTAPAVRRLKPLQRLALAALLLTALAFIVSLLLLPVARAQGKPATELRIGYQKSASLFVLQKAQGTLEKRLAPLGVGVKWIEFPAGPQLLEGLNLGSVDVGYVGEAPPIFAQAAGAKFVYIGYDPASPEAEALLVPKDSSVRSLSELKGKKNCAQQGQQCALPAGQAAGEKRPEAQRRAAGLPCAG